MSLRGLYAITPDGLDKPTLLTGVEAALRGGVRLVQYRDKARRPAEQADRAYALLTLCRRFGARLIVNDNVALTRSVDRRSLALDLGGDDLPGLAQLDHPAMKTPSSMAEPTMST